MCCLPIRQVQKSVDITLNNNQIIPGRFAGWLVDYPVLHDLEMRIIRSYDDLVPFLNQEINPIIYECFYAGNVITAQAMVTLRNIPVGTLAWRVPCRMCGIGIWCFSVPPEGNRLCDNCFKDLAERFSCIVSG